MTDAYLMVDPPGDGIRNMAVDAWLWTTHTPARPPVLRIYRWRHATVSLGYHQRPDGVVDRARCHRLGVDIVRRPTGGGAVLHDMEITYTVVATPAQLGVRRPLDAYARIATALLAGLARYPIVGATLVLPETPVGRVDGFCFAQRAHYEIAVHGAKLIGSAQRWGRHAILQHGSILLDWNPRWADVFRMRIDPGEFTTLRHVLGTAPDPERLIRCILWGFRRVFGWRWRRRVLRPSDPHIAAMIQRFRIRVDVQDPVVSSHTGP